jgi:hypothetical protein
MGFTVFRRSHFQVVLARGWSSLEIQPLSEAERKNLVLEYLALHSKTLTEELLALIVTSPQAQVDGREFILAYPDSDLLFCFSLSLYRFYFVFADVLESVVFENVA